MISVIDHWTDAIIKLQSETYIRLVFFDLIAPGDYATQLRLAQELLKKYGPTLFPDTELLPHYVVGLNLEEFIKAFVMHLQAIRREWQH